ncbi:hypothetical protein CBM2634_P130002 [Cupriavidus taiwanensis]|uniref:Uncharacterized protein n=1 Tax=Cupriavidus taiwanensis TaxID=164546 RepID=A0A375JDR8_9BURK|nr:hypothetical protein CBM2634_P130002 [Cupriavidus taiwanensis]
MSFWHPAGNIGMEWDQGLWTDPTVKKQSWRHYFSIIA